MNTQENLPPLELWIQDIQSYLYKVLRMTMEPAGFRFHRSNYSFYRKHIRNLQELGFIFVNRFPIQYRINFILVITNNRIRLVKSAFAHWLDEPGLNLSSLVLLMGDFSGENLLHGEQQDYTLFSNRDLFDAADSLNRILQNQVIPLCNRIGTMEDIDNFFAEHPGWTALNLNIDNIVSELITARLNRKRDFQAIYREVMEGIGQSPQTAEVRDMARKMTESCYAFLEKKY